MRPGEHCLGVLALEEPAPHEKAEHGPAKRFGELRGVVRGPRHERTIRPETAVGRNHMNVRVPIRERPVGLDAAHDPHRERGLSGERANGRRHRARGDSREIAEERPPVETPRAEPLRDGEHHLAMWHPGDEERVLQPQRPDG
jgi:hypothetical protein